MLVVVLYSSTQSLTPYTSTDISTFTARTSLSLTVVHNSEGRNKSIAGAVIGGTTVLHTAESQRSSTTSHKSYHSRAQFAGTTPTWAADTILRTADSINYAQTYEGPATGIDSNKKVVQVYGWDSTLDTDFGVARYPNADAGTSWTIGSPTISDLGSTTAEISSHWFGSLGSGTYLVIADNAAVLNAPTNLNWSLWNGASFSAVASVFSGATTINSNDWGACVDSNGKVHCVRRTAATTYEHRIYSAGAWGAGATIPAQASLGTSGGVPLVADASGNVYLAVLTASPGAVKYIKYNGSAWDGSWSTLESSSATRAYLTVVPQVVNNQLVWLWTEGASSPFSVNGEALTLVTSHALAASATGGGTATAQLTVDHLLTASATGGASATAQLTVKHNLTASATAGASATALLTVKHPLQASATGGASASAQVTVAHHLTASATCGGSATAVLTVVGPHHLAASATGGGTATALLTVKHLLAASATAGASATAQLTIQHQLSAAATAGATATVKLTIQHQLSASASAGATALATLLILHHLFASAPAGGTATALLTHLSTTVLLTPSGTLSAGVVPLGSAATGSAPSGIMAAQPLPAGGISDGTTPGGTIAVGTTPAGAIVRE